LGRGRDIEDIDYELFWDPDTWCWQCKGNSSELKIVGQKREALDALASLGRTRLTDWATATGIDKGNLYRIASNLWTEGFIHKDTIGKDTYYEVKQPNN